MTTRLLLAGDVGGTNTRLALFEPGARTPAVTRVYHSAADSTLEQIAARFLDEAKSSLGGPLTITAGCIGVAGPVENNVCRATNLPWTVDGRQLGQHLAIEKLRLINDFVALARSVPELGSDDLRSFGGGTPRSQRPIAVLGPGTGLGHAFLLWSETDGRYRVVASEGGHVDFAPRSPLEQALLGHLTLRYGRVSNERVLSGQGLIDIFAFLDSEPAWREQVTPEVRARLATEDGAAVISSAATAGTDPVCHAALSLLASALGAVAGNLALLVLATGGVFIGGGIAPRLVDFFAASDLRRAFEQKGRFRPLLESIPLAVITAEQPGLRGAAAWAAEL